MSAETMSAITRSVRDMYTRFPYPPPEAIDGTPISAIMDFTRHIFWPGRSDFSGLRVLDAGCGTGATAVSIARDHPEIDVVGIDLSETSLGHARALADSFGVGNNLQLRALPIQEVGALGQRFDYIVATGVIHHLDDPEQGLAALADVLTPSGGISLMVYAKYGRAGVYMLQEAMRVLGSGADFPELTVMARSLLTQLQTAHPFNANKYTDVDWTSDAGIVDLLLNVRDRSYTVAELFDLLDGAGLELTRFMDPVAYDPATYVQEPALNQSFRALDARSRSAVAELLYGRMRKHWLCATQRGYTPFRPPTVGLVLLALRPRRSPLYDWGGIAAVDNGQDNLMHLSEHRVSDVYIRGFDFAPWQMSAVDECDGIRTAREVFDLPRVHIQIPGANLDEKLQQFGQLFEVLAQHEIILCD